MKRWAFVTLVVVLASGLIVGTAAAADGTTKGPDAAVDAAESLESALEVVNETMVQYASGALFGIGIGLMLGSGVTFAYWKRRIG